MNKNVFKLIDKLFVSSENPLTLNVLQRLFNSGIPFNGPHKFKFLELSASKSRIKLPLIRLNKNHLGGMHACAIATLGEYPAGLTLIKYFGTTKYRIVLKKIEVNYLKQGNTDLTGVVDFPEKKIKQIENELLANKQTDVVMHTNILNKSEEIVAIVETTWQLKDWKAVHFKG